MFQQKAWIWSKCHILHFTFTIIAKLIGYSLSLKWIFSWFFQVNIEHFWVFATFADFWPNKILFILDRFSWYKAWNYVLVITKSLEAKLNIEVQKFNFCHLVYFLFWTSLFNHRWHGVFNQGGKQPKGVLTHVFEIFKFSSCTGFLHS